MNAAMKVLVQGLIPSVSYVRRQKGSRTRTGEGSSRRMSRAGPRSGRNGGYYYRFSQIGWRVCSTVRGHRGSLVEPE